jgi:23S rRNA (adenine2503-C2)-methyltransferase
MARADKVADFVALLEDRNLIVNVRRSRGKDIDAACGQLVNNNTRGAEAVRKSTAAADNPE